MVKCLYISDADEGTEAGGGSDQSTPLAEWRVSDERAIKLTTAQPSNVHLSCTTIGCHSRQ